MLDWFPSLRECPLMQGATTASLQAVATHGVSRGFRAGAVLCLEDQLAQRAFIVREGTVGLLHRGPSGQQVLTQLIRRGGIVGITEVVGQRSRRHRVEALTAVQALEIPANTLTRLLHADPALCLNGLRLLATEQAAEARLQRALAFQSVEERLAGLLFHFLQLYGRVQDDGVLIDFRLTYDALARFIGATKRSVERSMGAWLREPWLSRQRHHYTVHDVDPLLLRAGDEPFLTAAPLAPSSASSPARKVEYRAAATA